MPAELPIVGDPKLVLRQLIALSGAGVDELAQQVPLVRFARLTLIKVAMRGAGELDGRTIGPLVAHQLRDRQSDNRVVERFLEGSFKRLALCQAAKVDILSLPIRGRVDAVRPVLHST